MRTLRGGGTPLLVRQDYTVDIAATPDRVWSLLSDTDRLNRELNLPPVQYCYEPRVEGGSRLCGKARIGGHLFEYREDPYCWTRPTHWSVRRVIDGSPLALIRPGVDLSPLPDGTGVRVFCEVEARSFLHLPLARAVARASAKGLANVCRGFDAFVRGVSPTPYPRHQNQYPAHLERLQRGVEQLKTLGIEASLAERLGRHLQETAIEEVNQFRPYVLADAWQIEREQSLGLCLMAVRAGLLDMRWRVLCPSCRGASTPADHLSELADTAHCPSCNVQWGPRFDESVEVCFSVAPRIRQHQLRDATYCAGGPSRSPHVATQWQVPPHANVRMPVEAALGEHRLTSPQAAHSYAIQSDDSDCARSPSIRLVPQNNRIAIAPLHSDTVPTQSVWNWENETEFPVLVRVETPGWLTDIATAATVTSLQLFREQFGSEVLSPGVELAVQQIALLFTDLKESTRMYAERGDAPSYAVVREHFEFLRQIVAANGGGIVKTIGDAAMATFPDAADAFRAALEIQRQAPLQTDPLTIKIGVHAGPALAVNANGLLDYFGQVVNEAARIQAQSTGGDVVIAGALAADTHIAALLSAVHFEPFTAQLRGLSEPVDLLRCRVPASSKL